MKGGEALHIGTNSMHVSPQTAKVIGCSHVEICLMWQGDLEESIALTYQTLDEVESLAIPYSIHLPIHLGDYSHGVFSSFFLDSNEALLESSYKLIEENLQALARFKPQFYVMHFAGVYPLVDSSVNEEKVTAALNRLNDLAGKHHVKLYLEYFGLNENLIHPEQWRCIKNFPNLGVLIDTGHLYFSARMHGLDYQQMLVSFCEFADAYHVWNTQMAPGVYDESASYRAYHHIAPRRNQKKENGFSIDMEWTMRLLASTLKPVIVEASTTFGGEAMLVECLKEWVSFE